MMKVADSWNIVAKKNYPFYQQYLKDRDINKFINSLNRFKADLGLSEQDITDIKQYLKKRGKNLSSISSSIAAFKKSVLNGNIDSTYKASIRVVRDFMEMAEYERAIFPDEYRSLDKEIRQMMQLLTDTRFPPEKLAELRGILSANRK